ncbi:amidohydrolase [Pacificispira spongiicola]|nr:amidohydrolase [Pacificispira spongiicola]
MATECVLVSGGRVFTADPGLPWAEAVVIRNDRIVFVGDLKEAASIAGEDPTKIDAAGGLIMPGFVDGHVHVAMTGASMRKAQLRGAGSVEEIRRRVLKWANEHPDEPRVLGTSWVHGDIPNGQPNKSMLDDIVPDRPVYLEAFDFHSSWLNSQALRELGIDDATPDPVGGEIVRDPTSGEATGWLQETASTNMVWPLLSNVSDDELEKQVLVAAEAFSRAGITSVVEMALEERVLESIARIQAAGKLTVRVVGHMIIWRTGDLDDEIRQVERAAELARQYQGDMLRVIGIKLIGDGTIDGCTAALSQPYTDGTNCDPIWPAEVLTPIVAAADKVGLQVAIHAIGDATIDAAIDAIEGAATVNATTGRRHRIEHLEYARDDQIERIGTLGITASMQPVHVNPAYLSNWLEKIGPERGENGFAWPLYIKAGAPLAFGTDTPTAPYEALPNMYIAATRKAPGDDTIAPHRPDWALPMEDALTHGTREPAWAAHLDSVTGMLKPGLAADVVILDTDFFQEGPAALLKTDVRLTMVGGKVVFSA